MFKKKRKWFYSYAYENEDGNIACKHGIAVGEIKGEKLLEAIEDFIRKKYSVYTILSISRID